MAELATIARPYAEALFKSIASGTRVVPNLSTASKWLNELATIASDEHLLQFANNPKIQAQQVFDLIINLSRVNLPLSAQNFLRTVIDNGRLQALPEMAAQFRALSNARGGSFDAIVYSAFALDDDALTDLTATLEKRFGRKLHATLKIDEALIGGIRVVVGDEVLDTSVKARLEQMKAALAA